MVIHYRRAFAYSADLTNPAEFVFDYYESNDFFMTKVGDVTISSREDVLLSSFNIRYGLKMPRLQDGWFKGFNLIMPSYVDCTVSFVIKHNTSIPIQLFIKFFDDDSTNDLDFEIYNVNFKRKQKI